MDEQGFIAYMKKTNRSEGTMKRYMVFMRLFEEFLAGLEKSLGIATPENLNVFLQHVDSKYRKFSYVSSVRVYYEFTGNERMKYALDELDFQRPHPYKLGRLIGVHPEHIHSLSTVGIVTGRELLAAGRSKQDRDQLANITGIPSNALMDLIKLADLLRKWGPVRARLYYDAGFDTFEKIAAMEPDEFIEKIKEYIDSSGVNFIPPPPKDAHSAIEGAKRRPKLIEE
jgi:hypothetical protein